MTTAAKPLMLALTLLCSGCASVVSLPPGTGQDLTDERDAKAAWAQVLARHVDAQGRVDFAGVAVRPQALEAWLQFVARVSPRSDPQRFASINDQLAYYIDAYNALALYGVINSGVMPAQKLRFFLLRQYTIGGETMSLYAFENDVIRPLSDARIHFALNCMAAGCPRLPQQPWRADTLDSQLDAAAREFFASERHLRVNEAERTVFLSAILDFFPEDFLAEEPSLIAYVNRYRQPPIPLDYTVEFIPYDWSTNSQ